MIFRFIPSNNILDKYRPNLLDNYLFVYKDYIVLIKYIIEYDNAWNPKDMTKEVKIEFHTIDLNQSA